MMHVIEQDWYRRVIALDARTLKILCPLLADIEAVFHLPNVRWLQNSSRASLIKHEVDGRLVVIKHYKLKNLDKRIRRAVTPSRAYRSWKGAQRLAAIGLATPRPWAMIENRFGPLRGRAWLINDYCPGQSIVDAYLEASASARKAIEREIVKMFCLLRQHKISHRDTKGANFLWHDGRLWILDLDSIRYHRTALGAEQGSRRDRRRFLKNWEQVPEIQQRLAEVIERAFT